jgi:flagellar motility protein MotE (MotC chaperone)
LLVKKLLSVLVLTLAINFLAITALVGWLHQSNRLDRAKVLAIREILFSAPPRPVAATQGADDSPVSEPLQRLEGLLAGTSGLPAAKQVQSLQHALYARVVELARLEREIKEAQREIELARQQLARDRAAVDQRRAELATEHGEASRLALEKGFQDSLSLYITMPPRQVKSVFMTLDDATASAYLEAMPPRVAAKIIREFKSTEEGSRLHAILERMRQPRMDEPAAVRAGAQD